MTISHGLFFDYIDPVMNIIKGVSLRQVKDDEGSDAILAVLVFYWFMSGGTGCIPQMHYDTLIILHD